jgi:hypothetical protein
LERRRHTGPDTDGGLLTFLLVIVWAGAAGSALWWGLDYYRLPLQERAYSDLAPLFAPTGLVGQGVFIGGELPTPFLRQCGVEVETKFGEP